jgi:hypothetical protein
LIDDPILSQNGSVHPRFCKFVTVNGQKLFKGAKNPTGESRMGMGPEKLIELTRYKGKQHLLAQSTIYIQISNPSQRLELAEKDNLVLTSHDAHTRTLKL